MPSEPLNTHLALSPLSLRDDSDNGDDKNWKEKLKLPPPDTRIKTAVRAPSLGDGRDCTTGCILGRDRHEGRRVRGVRAVSTAAQGHLREGLGAPESHPGGIHRHRSLRYALSSTSRALTPSQYSHATRSTHC